MILREKPSLREKNPLREGRTASQLPKLLKNEENHKLLLLIEFIYVYLQAKSLLKKLLLLNQFNV